MLSVIGLNCMEAAYNRTKPNKRLFMSEIRYMQTEAVDKGSLKVEVVTGRMRRPIEGAQIAISYSGDPDSRVEEVKADASGMSEELVLDAPPLEYSMEPSAIFTVYRQSYRTRISSGQRVGRSDFFRAARSAAGADVGGGGIAEPGR